MNSCTEDRVVLPGLRAYARALEPFHFISDRVQPSTRGLGTSRGQRHDVEAGGP
jgi:hypothetical protein